MLAGLLIAIEGEYFSVLTQVVVNALSATCIYILMALGFGLIYAAARFFNFAHGASFTLGAYLPFLLHTWFGFPLFPAAFIGLHRLAGAGVLLDSAVYRPLRARRASPLILLMTSLGVYISLQNLISLVFGDDSKGFGLQGLAEFKIFGARATSIQLTIFLATVALLFLTYWLQKRTRLGFAMRAVADDLELAKTCDIDTDKVIALVFGLGSFLAGLAGFLVALDVNMVPTMGMRALMMAVVVVLVAGGSSTAGVVLAALLLAFAQHAAVFWISSRWQEAIAFALLLILLVVRPTGLSRRVATRQLEA